MSYPRLCSDGALQTAHDIWENCATGASHAGDSFLSGPLADKGLLGSPHSQHGILWQARGEPQYLETFRVGAETLFLCLPESEGADPGSELSHLGLAPPRDRDLGRLDLGSDGFWNEDYG